MAEHTLPSHAEHPLEDVLDDAIHAAHGEKVCLTDLLDEYGTRSFGPILVIVALIIISPVGGIPLLPVVLGAIVSLLSVQLAFGAKHPWMPQSMRKIGFDKQKMINFREKEAKWLERGDRFIQPRLEWVAGNGTSWLIALCLIFLSAMMVPMELVPFAATVPAIAMLFFGIGLTARDGVMTLLGFATTIPSIWLTWYWWPFGMPGGWVNG
ncbi:exopolysaccharide biosynthesis protein [uncultured Parasphingopyxis sp.]|uniref:exopolysaccharide biosynthesis protein n=1 Tax=uncultured Parasphingopyxis sp. TaxID=1547918 RepID=UPI002619C259|nr:exopolysaccharide biosynthesis protein [uncultured Parasphingopyxis sp.]